MAVPARTDAPDVIVELLTELDKQPAGMGGPEFYDRLCTALCSVANMQRAGLLLYDEVRKLVVPVGSHGLDAPLLRDIYGTLEETPIAQVALSEDRVVEVTDEIGSWVPERYAHFPGIETLTCTPVSAGGRWLGVIFADRGGGRFTLTEDERQTMFAFGKAAALAASTRIGAAQQMRARELSARLELARELHEQVVQRLFGVSLALGSEHQLTAEERNRCASEIQEAIADMRTAISRPLTPPSLDTGASLRDELGRLGRHYGHLPLKIDWEEGTDVPEALEPLTQAVLAEALRNCEKHASPTRVDVRIGRQRGTFFLEVRNDGATTASNGGQGSRMGLRLAALEAIQSGGMVEFGPVGRDEWKVRLVLPLKVVDA